mmetsp:Transcript_36271/g.93526  ORF Transcript_36271/g.93526 Transcript_36271/m.93526 type:complete len:217 (-) Transcript_36271:1134-1784(-)
MRRPGHESAVPGLPLARGQRRARGALRRPLRRVHSRLAAADGQRHDEAHKGPLVGRRALLHGRPALGAGAELRGRTRAVDSARRPAERVHAAAEGPLGPHPHHRQGARRHGVPGGALAQRRVHRRGDDAPAEALRPCGSGWAQRSDSDGDAYRGGAEGPRLVRLHRGGQGAAELLAGGRQQRRRGAHAAPGRREAPCRVRAQQAGSSQRPDNRLDR